MITRALAGLGVLALVAGGSYLAGRSHGVDAERTRWERRAEIVRERVRAEVVLIDEITFRIERVALPALAAHTERAAARAQETDRALASRPDLAALPLPDDLHRLRQQQVADSRRIAETQSAER